MDQNANIPPGQPASEGQRETGPDGRPDVTSRITRGVTRLLHHAGDAVVPEMRLANGRRADLVGLSPKGLVTIVEIKSCQADYEVDQKWPDYLAYCDRFFFAVDDEFPTHLLPTDEGLIIADGFGGGIIRPSQERALAGARRKAMTLRFARQAALAAYRAEL